jgi:hypothetical protein
VVEHMEALDVMGFGRSPVMMKNQFSYQWGLDQKSISTKCIANILFVHSRITFSHDGSKCSFAVTINRKTKTCIIARRKIALRDRIGVVKHFRSHE